MSAQCERGVDIKRLQDHVDEAEKNVGKEDFEAAAIDIARVADEMLCTTGPIPKDILQKAYAVMGAYHLNDMRGEAELGHLYLERSTTISPNGDWPGWLESSGKETFDRYKQEKRGVDKVNVRFGEAEERRLRTIAIDGEALLPGKSLSLVPGEHLMQIEGPGGRWGSQWIIVPRTGSAFLLLDEAGQGVIIPEKDYLFSAQRENLLYVSPKASEQIHLGQKAAWGASFAFLGGAALATGTFFYSESRLGEGNCAPDPIYIQCEEWIARGHVAAGLAWGLGGAALTSGAAALLIPRLQAKKNEASNNQGSRFALVPGPGEVGVGLKGTF